jgi:hypothetical protein
MNESDPQKQRAQPGALLNPRCEAWAVLPKARRGEDERLYCVELCTAQCWLIKPCRPCPVQRQAMDVGAILDTCTFLTLQRYSVNDRYYELRAESEDLMPSPCNQFGDTISVFPSTCPSAPFGPDWHHSLFLSRDSSHQAVVISYSIYMCRVLSRTERSRRYNVATRFGSRGYARSTLPFPFGFLYHPKRTSC